MTDATTAYDLYREGRLQMERGEHAQAVIRLQESAAAEPHFKTLELLGECLTVLGRLREAIVPLAAATTLNTGVRAPALLAEVFWHLNQFKDAKDVAEIALGRDPRNRKARIVWDNVTQELSKRTLIRGAISLDTQPDAEETQP